MHIKSGVSHNSGCLKLFFDTHPKIGVWVGEGSPNFETNQNIANWYFMVLFFPSTGPIVSTHPIPAFFGSVAKPTPLIVTTCTSHHFATFNHVFNVHLPQDSTNPNQPRHIFFAWPPPYHLRPYLHTAPYPKSVALASKRTWIHNSSDLHRLLWKIYRYIPTGDRCRISINCCVRKENDDLCLFWECLRFMDRIWFRSWDGDINWCRTLSTRAPP